MMGRIAFGVLAGWVLLAVLAPWLVGDPNKINLTALLAVPDSTHWLGLDELGRPVLSRLIVGAQASVAVAFSVVTASALKRSRRSNNSTSTCLTP